MRKFLLKRDVLWMDVLVFVSVFVLFLQALEISPSQQLVQKVEQVVQKVTDPMVCVRFSSMEKENNCKKGKFQS